MDNAIALKLREKFPPELVGKLPRVTCPNCADRRKTCTEHTKSKCGVCQAYVSERHIHIDYVGHADVTARLLDTDPDWDWEPQARDIDPAVLAAAVATGNPQIVRAVLKAAPPKFDVDDDGNRVGLWISLTVCGVTRPGYGSVPSGQPDTVKVLIGDAIRNAAMRFGVALDLWAKGDRADPTAENATASGGNAARRGGSRQQSAGDAFDNAGPAKPQNGGGQANGHTSRPAANGARKGQPTEADIDPEAQPFFDEAHEARTVTALGEVRVRAREAGKLGAVGRNPATGGIGGFGAYANWRKKALEDSEAAWKELQDAAVQLSTGELEAHVQMVTGASLEGASAAQLREAAGALKAGVPA
jgi:hypothetical protein